jgi:3-deoxy-D-manno-octulosonate 8-phosphate phosphatase (KDO 8-P phosphatase)
MSNITLNDKLKKIKLLVMDVDGTLTDAKVYYSGNGEELKTFSIRDGMGIELLRKGGIESAFLTSENSKIVSSRAVKLKIEHVILGSHNKKKDVLTLCENLSLNTENIAFIGDDVNDLQAILISGVSACPKNATATIIENVDYICKTDGGAGAVREFCELILKAQNKPITLPESW